jgi:hypothetical protein
MSSNPTLSATSPQAKCPERAKRVEGLDSREYATKQSKQRERTPALVLLYPRMRRPQFLRRHSDRCRRPRKGTQLRARRQAHPYAPASACRMVSAMFQSCPSTRIGGPTKRLEQDKEATPDRRLSSYRLKSRTSPQAKCPERAKRVEGPDPTTWSTRARRTSRRGRSAHLLSQNPTLAQTARMGHPRRLVPSKTERTAKVAHPPPFTRWFGSAQLPQQFPMWLETIQGRSESI